MRTAPPDDGTLIWLTSCGRQRIRELEHQLTNQGAVVARLESRVLENAAIHGATTDEVGVIVKMLKFGLARVSLGKSERESANSALRKLGSP